MAVWDQLDNDELYFILCAEKLRYIQERFWNETKYANIRVRIPPHAWIDDARKCYQPKYKDYRLSLSVFSALNDAPSFLFMTLITIIGILSPKIFTLSILTGSFSFLTLTADALFFTASYQEQRDETAKMQKFMDFSTIKLECAKVLKHRLKTEFNALPDEDKNAIPVEYQYIVKPDPYSYENKSIITKLKPAVGASLLTFTMLLGTYYLGASVIIAAFGLTAAATIMTGFIGLGIAVAVAVAIGCYCGYCQYQSIVNRERNEKIAKHSGEEFRYHRDKCDALKNVISYATGSHHIVEETFPEHHPAKDLLHMESNPQASMIRRQNLYHRHNPKTHHLHPPVSATPPSSSPRPK